MLTPAWLVPVPNWVSLPHLPQHHWEGFRNISVHSQILWYPSLWDILILLLLNVKWIYWWLTSNELNENTIITKSPLPHCRFRQACGWAYTVSNRRFPPTASRALNLLPRSLRVNHGSSPLSPLQAFKSCRPSQQLDWDFLKDPKQNPLLSYSQVPALLKLHEIISVYCFKALFWR